MDQGFKELNQLLALSFREKGKRCSLTVSWSSLQVTLSLQKVEICKFGSSEGDPENWFCCTRISSAGIGRKKEEVSGKRKIGEKRRRKEKRVLITKKELIKLVYSPAAAPKT
ncbi:hypothetical protein MTR_6g463940 [Medicago truncatula]|uniref:Uncharacterized protein n=1 Tax=Medicago truncatula TaxID=3880 RepID=A0A072UBY3_MEDTR|nr:hypothetical protein MTR_6g463940 [Medicago truncatula]